MILIDPNNPKATKIHAQLSDLTDLSNLPFHLVFGGDGWMLQCIREHGHRTPFFGVNSGTLGFLLNSNADLTSYRRLFKSNTPWQIHDFLS